jgi:hypothetical protein
MPAHLCKYEKDKHLKIAMNQPHPAVPIQGFQQSYNNYILLIIKH